MARVFRGALLVCVLFTMAPAAARAQGPPPTPARLAPVEVTVFELVLRDGSRLYGTVEHDDEHEVVFRTRAGAIVTAPRTNITVLRKVTGVLFGDEFQRTDPNATRLFFGPTGRSLAKGQTYLGVYEFVMPFVQVGITDRFSIGGGTPLIFGLGDGDRPFWITPKLQVINGASTQVAVGLFQGANFDGDGGGIAYVVGTRGNTVNSFTIGGGLAYANDGGQSGIIMVGAEGTVRRNMKVITENYLWKEGTGVASAGVRFFGERLSADVALGIPIGAESFFVFPIVNFVYVF